MQRFAFILLLVIVVSGCKCGTLETIKRADALAALWQKDLEAGVARYHTDDELNEQAHKERLETVKKARENFKTAMEIEK